MDSNPFLPIITGIFEDLRLWGLAIIGPVAGFALIKDGLKYKAGDEMERRQAKKSMKGTIGMAGGIYLIIWLVGYVLQKVSAVNISL